MRERYGIERTLEITYEIIDNKTGEMVERFSNFDPKDFGEAIRYTHKETRKRAYDFLKKLRGQDTV